MTEEGPARPVIVMAVPPLVAFQPTARGNSHTQRPSRTRQGERLDARFNELKRLLDGSSAAEVVDELPPGDPELVVVFEIIDTTVVDASRLANAFRKVGLEPLLDVEGQFDDDAIPDDFARLPTKRIQIEPIKRFLHACMANERAVEELLRIWTHWKTDRRMFQGFGAFTELFKQLHDVRAWGPADRVRSTGLSTHVAEALRERLADVPLIIELWYRTGVQQRQVSEQRVRDAIAQMGGHVFTYADRPEIGYHALAATLPATTLEPVRSDIELEHLQQVKLLQTSDVLFVRPGGQRLSTGLENDLAAAHEPEAEMPTGPPILAAIDGLPASNHPYLRDRLEILDPDDLSSDPTYTVERRRHGTMVASVLIWGDLGAGEKPARRKIVIRPMLAPDMHTQNEGESIPRNQLPADLTIRSVREVLSDVVGPNGESTIRIINVSLGDPLAQFDTIPTAWARAIDWLSYEFNLLFIVAAGNHPSQIQLTEEDLRNPDGAARDAVTADALAQLSARRRLLSPAESLNALTIGALHSDAAGESYELGYQIDLWSGEGHPSPTTAHGRGIRRAIKPDLAAPGGRQLYTSLPSGPVEPMMRTALPPGIEVAAPPDKTAFVCGTTFAATDVSRRAARIVESLRDATPRVGDKYEAVSAKALLVHGAAFPHNASYGIPTDRLVGYGSLDRDLAAGCLNTQSTILFTGDIGPRQRTDIQVPFPHDIASLSELRRITVTLAWFSPINWNHRHYRRAKLTINGPPQIPSNLRNNLGPDYRLTERGTVLHRVFETDRAFTEETLTFTVKCFDQAGGFTDTIPFALAISLEVGTGVNLDVYSLVKNQLQTRTRIR